MNESALIVGAGNGLSASLARLFHEQGMRVVLAARNADKLKALADATDAVAFSCDAAEPADVRKLFSAADEQIGTPDIVVYNPSARVRGPVSEIAEPV